MVGNVQDVDLKLLRVFRAVVQHGGFIAAQLELNVGLSSISNQIKQLEERLGVRLCERGNLGFRLTPHGQLVARASETLFSALEDFRNDVSESATKPVGEVRLGIVDNLITDPNCRISQAIAVVHKSAPGVAVDFCIAPPSELESQVINGSLDIAIGLFPAVPNALDSVLLFRESHALYCSREHPLFHYTEDELQNLDLSESAYVSWAYQENYVSVNPTAIFNVQGATPFMEGLLYLVLSGCYIGYLPRHSADRWAESGRLRLLLPEKTTRDVDVLMISRRSQRAKRHVAIFRAALIKAHGGR